MADYLERPLLSGSFVHSYNYDFILGDRITTEFQVPGFLVCVF